MHYIKNRIRFIINLLRKIKETGKTLFSVLIVHGKAKTVVPCRKVNCKKNFNTIFNRNKRGSRTAATSKMELFVIIVIKKNYAFFSPQ